MFVRYQISIEAIEEMLDNYFYLLEEDKSEEMQLKITDALQKALLPKDGIIKGDVLKREFFPTDTFGKKFNVFISHSHRDVDTVKQFVNILESHFHVNCFVDSMVWENVEDLQRLVDKNLPVIDEGYDYVDVLHTSAHVHSLLALSLYEMIDKCECCIFVGSENSLNLNVKKIRTETLSPWIYQEIFYMNHTKPNIPTHVKKLLKERCFLVAIESQINEVVMSHSVDLTGFVRLEPKHFKIDVSDLDEEAFLEILYINTKVLKVDYHG